jgi:uridine kinase
MSDRRKEFLSAIVALIPVPQGDGPNLIIGIDGVDGSGKTTLADELAALMPTSTRVSIDGFHHVRERRYRRGRSSPEGFWLDSYDYERFRREVIEPFRCGNGTYLPVGHDVDSDRLLTGPRRDVPRGRVLLIDGIFLHRPELVDAWDLSIFLDVPFAESVGRMSVRDGLPPDPDAVENARYVGGQKLYLAECRPADRATILVDYEDLDRPIIRRAARSTGRRRSRD